MGSKNDICNASDTTDDNLAQILTGSQTVILYCCDLPRKSIKDFNIPGCGATLVYHNTANLKLVFNFTPVLTIIKHTLVAFGAL